ncbi:moulting cycle domain-containing protein [Ditylenchus destructor]|uniref:Moulting cycle domain-containing protein n=1 Tax=Ditylenchus destructor TaxID=166010 RepID=A0AAD4MNV1_9BILA|nr:moulting cycle domain-containing protein [Ditylenchus destructor]
MSLPEDILLSVFKYLSRYNLDAVEICCRPYRSTVQKNQGRLPLRTITDIEYSASNGATLKGQGSDDDESGDNTDEKSESEPYLSVTGNDVSHSFHLHTELERGINCLSYSFVGEFNTFGMHCEPVLSHAILTSPGLVIGSLIIADYRFHPGDSQTIETLLSGCKIQGLDIIQSVIPGSQINDHFLQHIGRAGTNRVQLYDINEGTYELSEDGILDYCFFIDNGSKRTLILTDVSITPPFLGKCIEASKKSPVTSNVELYIAKISEKMIIPNEYEKFATLKTKNLGFLGLTNPELDLEDIKEGMRLKIVTQSKLTASRSGRGDSMTLAFVMNDPKSAEKKLEKMDRLKLNEPQLKELNNMHRIWYLQAVNSLLGAMGKETYSRMNAAQRRSFIKCLEGITEELDIRKGAQCLVAAWDNKLSLKVTVPSKQFEKVGGDQSIAKVNINSEPKDQESFVTAPASRRLKWLQRKRLKRDMLHFPGHYKQSTAEEKIVSSKSMANVPEIKSRFQPPTTPTATIASMFSNWMHVFNKNGARNKGNSYYQKLKELNKLIGSEPEDEKRPSQPLSMLDIVLDGDPKSSRNRKKRARKENFSFLNIFNRLIPPKLRDKFGGILRALDSAYKDESEVPNWSVLSPKFGSVFKKKTRPTNSGNFLSPNLFPLYSDNSSSSILPVPDMLKAAGVTNEEDQNAMLELILQASGAGSIVNKALQVFKNDSGEVLSDILTTSQRIDKQFIDIENSLNHRQRREMAERKYTLLNEKQLEKVYGLYNTTQHSQKFPFDLKAYGKLDEVGRKRALMHAIRRLAAGNVEKKRHRGRKRPKRQEEEEAITGLAFGVPTGETVEVFEDITLSPFSFAPTITHAIILGPVTFSPSIFSPYILGPSVLSPVTFSPGVGNPLILSPYVLEPYVMSPEIFAVGILSPYVIAPNVLNPFVMSPIILSPHVLSPDVLSPTLLSGAILSPFVFSPAIFTESALALDVLSPSMFSRKRRK